MGNLVLAGGNPLEPPVHGRALIRQPEALPGEAARIAAAERILGHRFARPALLREAMTHRSAARRHPGGRRGAGSNERLEFIGDRVLGLLMAEWLIERYPAEQEGDLGRRLAHLVSQPTLADIADRIALTEMLSVAPGEERAGVKNRATVVADLLEAAIGALYLDGGLDPARAFIRTSFEPVLHGQPEPPKDAKTGLQEWAQARGHDLPRYAITARSGPPHDPAFTVTVVVQRGPKLIGTATGAAGNKREAEQGAAVALLHILDQGRLAK